MATPVRVHGTEFEAMGAAFAQRLLGKE